MRRARQLRSPAQGGRQRVRLSCAVRCLFRLFLRCRLRSVRCRLRVYAELHLRPDRLRGTLWSATGQGSSWRRQDLQALDGTRTVRVVDVRPPDLVQVAVHPVEPPKPSASSERVSLSPARASVNGRGFAAELIRATLPYEGGMPARRLPPRIASLDGGSVR